MGHDFKVRVPCVNDVIFWHLPLLKNDNHKIFSGSSTLHPEIEQRTFQSEEVLRNLSLHQWCILTPSLTQLYVITWEVFTLTFWHRSFTFNSNKSPTWCNNFSVNYPDVCLQLNMFRAFSRPSSGAKWLQWQPLVLPSVRPARPRTRTTIITIRR
jgi:hypothetical protein